MIEELFVRCYRCHQEILKDEPRYEWMARGQSERNGVHVHHLHNGFLCCDCHVALMMILEKEIDNPKAVHFD